MFNGRLSPRYIRIVFVGYRLAFVQTPAGIVGTPDPHHRASVGVRREDWVKRPRGSWCQGHEVKPKILLNKRLADIVLLIGDACPISPFT